MSIKTKAISAAKWTTITTISSQILTLFLSIIKYRLLDIEVFGIMAIVTSFYSILRMIQTMGFGPAIVQKDTLDNIFINSVFWIIFVISVFLAGILILCSKWISNFYNIEILQILLIITSVHLVFNSFITLQNYLLARDLKFKIIGLVNLISSVGGGATMIILAYYNFGIWSLVSGTIVSSVITFFLFLRYCKWFPSLIFNWPSIKPYLRFSVNITSQKFVTVLRLYAPQLIIGRFLGTEILGIYSFANNIILIIVNQVDAMISSVLFPLFSRLQKDIPKIIKSYIKINHFTFLAIFPILAGYVFLANEIVEFVYGSKWLVAVTISQILLISVVFNSIIGKGSSILTAIGKPEILLKIELIFFIPVIIAFLISVQYGLIYIVIVMVFEKCLILITQLKLLKKFVNIRFLDIVRCAIEPFTASLLMVLLIYALRFLLPKTLEIGIELLILIIMGGIGYFISIFFLDREELISTFKIVFKSK